MLRDCPFITSYKDGEGQQKGIFDDAGGHRWAGAEHQTQQEIYTEIYQHYPSNRAKSCNINNNEARKLDKYLI